MGAYLAHCTGNCAKERGNSPAPYQLRHHRYNDSKSNCAKERNNPTGTPDTNTDFNRHGPARSKSKVNYLLSGIIWCGECNHKMTGASSSYLTKKSKEYKQKHYYTCNFGNRTKQCDNEKINKELVESHVLKELEQKIFNDSVVPVIAKKIYRFYHQQQGEYAKETRQIEKELDNINKQVNNLVNALAVGGIAIQPIIEQLKTLENKKAILETQLREWQIKSHKDIINEESIIMYLEEKKHLVKNKNPETQKRVIQEFVEKVIVSKECIDVLFKITVDLSGGGGGS
ncbi:zinc ribbon domain-containing protein [Desulfallas sp. Bu1-1]|uniref:zinc ribbon domain-containing protein n=1 Tax=Desulfallas sp. Bu1-1 TaxID=2787620 RepID=UPI00189E4EAD|nr:zinc ribbon domain-containing protein [Desulfallas sp. Bu1-1]MBF7081688.1 zinc ribbon domain-containing protein [Desulfallas sp. Bu1-1]